jgi:hypothetical protein
MDCVLPGMDPCNPLICGSDGVCREGTAVGCSSDQMCIDAYSGQPKVCVNCHCIDPSTGDAGVEDGAGADG